MLSPTTPYFHVKAAETMLLEHATPPSRRTVCDRLPRIAATPHAMSSTCPPPCPVRTTPQDISAWRNKLEGARDHAAHAVHMSGSTYPRACWVLCLVRVLACHAAGAPLAASPPRTCASPIPPQACAACTLASSSDVKCVAPAAIMRSIANGKLPSGTSFVQQTGHTGASSQFGDFDIALDAAAVAAHADDNAALLVAAMQGLRDMYADAAFQPSAEVMAAAQRDPVNNSDGTYVVGSWAEAADSLALIASAALAGADSK